MGDQDQPDNWADGFFDKGKRRTFRLPAETVKLLEEKVLKQRRSEFVNQCILNFLKPKA